RQQATATQRPCPGDGGRGAALLIGALAFAGVLLRIVGVTVAYLVLRPGGNGGAVAAPGAEVSQSADTPSPGTGEETDTASAAPTAVEEERCWRPATPERTSSNTSGPLRAGGLPFTPRAVR